MLEDVSAAVGDRDEQGARRRPADRRDRVGPPRRLPGLPHHALGRPRPDRLVGETQDLARGQHRQAGVRQEPGAAIIADPAGAPQPAMAGEIQRRVVVHHQHDRMLGRSGPDLRHMRVHDRLPGDRPAVEQPVRRLGSGARAELAWQALVRSPGDRRHGAHQTIGSSGVPQIRRSKLGLGPMIRLIQHARPLAQLPADAGSAIYMRILAAKEKCG